MGTTLASLLLWTLFVGLVSGDMAIPLTSTSDEDQKTYYTPDPHAGSPPSGFSITHKQHIHPHTHIPLHSTVLKCFVVLSKMEDFKQVATTIHISDKVHAL